MKRNAAAVDGLDTNDIVSNRTVAVTSWTGPIRGHDASERGFGSARDVDRKELIFTGNESRQLGHANSCLDKDRHVARRVVDNSIESGEVEACTSPRRRDTVIERGLAAKWLGRLVVGES